MLPPNAIAFLQEASKLVCACVAAAQRSSNEAPPQQAVSSEAPHPAAAAHTELPALAGLRSCCLCHLGSALIVFGVGKGPPIST